MIAALGAFTADLSRIGRIFFAAIWHFRKKPLGKSRGHYQLA